MHTMPTPIVHRDIKSLNIMVVQSREQDMVVGKLGDCGESRRIDLNATMTHTGSPLWAAPELLAGRRYCERVDTYALGVVLYEIATREFPYAHERKVHSGKHGSAKGRKELMQKITDGKLRPRINPQVRKKMRIGDHFVKREFHILLKRKDT